MKTTIISLFLFAFCQSPASCQNWDELFRQKKTQQLYLREQISALKAYQHLVRQGYTLKGEGLLEVFGQADEEKTAHHRYFQSLKLVNPSLGVGAFLQEVERLRVTMERSFLFLQKQELPPYLLLYVNEVKNTVLARNAHHKTEIQKVASSGHFEMTDAERLHRLQQLIAAFRKDYGFTVRFTEGIMRHARRRTGNLKEMEDLRKLKP